MSTKRGILALVGGYLVISLVGAALLSLPFATRGGISPMNALFTAVSALCVTGLIVVDTATTFTLWGKAVLLTLIELGGLGYMTVGTIAIFGAGRVPSLTLRGLITESNPGLPLAEARRAVRVIALSTLTLQALGAALLFATLPGELPNRALHAVFLSMSSFCNAGFSTLSDNLAGVATSGVLLVVSSLVVVGGLGFVVYISLLNLLLRRRRRLDQHARVVLLTTALLVVLPLALLLALEWNNGLAGFNALYKPFAALLLSISPRTAGFSSLTVGSLTASSIIIIATLMVIGAAPGSTGGGIKVTTLAVLATFLRDTIVRKRSPRIYYRRVPQRTLHRTFSVMTMYVVAVVAATFILSLSDRWLFATGGMSAVFECISALSTVGLSLSPGNLSESALLSPLGKSLIIVLMLTGRIGPLTLLAVFAREFEERVKFPVGNLEVG